MMPNRSINMLSKLEINMYTQIKSYVNGHLQKHCMCACLMLVFVSIELIKHSIQYPVDPTANCLTGGVVCIT